MERERRARARPTRPGARLTDGAAQPLPGVAEVRGLGLLLAAELDDGIDAKAVAAALPRRGPRRQRGHARRALRLAPPLLVTDDEIDEAVAILGAGAARTASP